MKTVRLINATDTKARLADVRLVVVRDPSPFRPDQHEDLIFRFGKGDIFGFKVRESYGGESFICCADRDYLMEELKAMNFTTDEQKDKWLKEIRDAEKEEYQCWADGEIYGVVVEQWDAADRRWKTLECTYQLYGWKDVKSMIKELSDRNDFNIDAYCVDREAGDCDDMREDCVNVEICD